jgi:hypothetical protein
MKKSKQPIVRSKWNPPIPQAEAVYGEVVTVPNQTQSVRDILFKNTQGMTYDNYKTPYYEDQATFSSQPLNKIQEMEPTEKLQYLAEVKEQVNNLETKIQDFELQKQIVANSEKQSQPIEKNNEQDNTDKE